MPIDRQVGRDARDLVTELPTDLPTDRPTELSTDKPATAELPLRWRSGWLFALAGFFVMVVALGSIPGEAQALSDRYGDKLLHSLAYGFMTLLCLRALQAPSALRLFLAVGIIALLGLFDESLQSLLPYRNASAIDWCFDVAAAAIVAVLFTLHTHFFQVDRPRPHA